MSSSAMGVPKMKFKYGQTQEEEMFNGEGWARLETKYPSSQTCNFPFTVYLILTASEPLLPHRPPLNFRGLFNFRNPV